MDSLYVRLCCYVAFPVKAVYNPTAKWFTIERAQPQKIIVELTLGRRDEVQTRYCIGTTYTNFVVKSSNNRRAEVISTQLTSPLDSNPEC